MNKILFFGVMSVLFLPRLIFAETVINETEFNSDLTFKKSDSPYIIDHSIYIYGGYKVDFEAGSELILRNGAYFMSDSEVNIGHASSSEVVSIHGDGYFGVSEGDFNIHYANFDGIALSAYGNNINISSSTFINMNEDAIYLSGRAELVMKDSEISSSSKSAIKVQSGSKIALDHVSINGVSDGIVFENKVSLMNILFKNVFAEGYESSISNSSFENISGYYIKNKRVDTEFFVVDARNNWWGNPSGPDIDKLYGLVDYNPWLNESPINLPDIITDNSLSNVIFIPGIQASRLYNRENGQDKKRWEPLSSYDVSKLYLDQNGDSVDSTVKSKGVIDTVFTMDIYGSFIKFLEQMVSDKEINDWLALDYDWRLSVDDIAINLAQKVIDSASSSPSGKVIAIAHSNGGLVLKEIINYLSRHERLGIIEKGIFVAVPELGAPKAIGSILHGDGQEIGYGLILNKETAKGLVENMNGAFGLLPSRKFFEVSDNNAKKVIEIRDTSKISWFPKVYGAEIKDYPNFKKFINGENGTRQKPSISDKEKPNVLKDSFIEKADGIHNEIDGISALIPNMISIIGTGLLTPSGIIYDQIKEMECSSILGCTEKYVLGRDWKYTDKGDGTVTANSAEYLYGSKYYADLASYNAGGLLGANSNINHANILKFTSIQNLIKKLISSVNENISELPDYISLSPNSNEENTMNSLSQESKWVKFKTHSPVDILVIDSMGRKSGVLRESNGISKVINEIPNSVIDDSGSEGVILPNDSYNVTLTGNDTGFFGLSIEKFDAEVKTIATSNFNNIPVSISTVANLNYFERSPLASTTVNIDINSDGINDVKVKANSELSFADIIKMIRLRLKDNISDNKALDKLLKKIDKIERSLSKDKHKKVIKSLDKLLNSRQAVLIDAELELLLNALK